MDHLHDLGVMPDVPITKVRQHPFLDNGPVEVAAGDVHAAAGIDLTLDWITQSHHCDVERATAEVENDHALRFTNGLFVIQCGSDWLKLKINFLEASFVRSVPESLLCLVILLGRIGKFHGSSKRDSMDWFSKHLFCTFLQQTQIGLCQIAHRVIAFE